MSARGTTPPAPTGISTGEHPGHGGAGRTARAAHRCGQVFDAGGGGGEPHAGDRRHVGYGLWGEGRDRDRRGHGNAFAFVIPGHIIRRTASLRSPMVQGSSLSYCNSCETRTCTNKSVWSIGPGRWPFVPGAAQERDIPGPPLSANRTLGPRALDRKRDEEGRTVRASIALSGEIAFHLIKTQFL